MCIHKHIDTDTTVASQHRDRAAPLVSRYAIGMLTEIHYHIPVCFIILVSPINDKPLKANIHTAAAALSSLAILQATYVLIVR